MFKVYIYISGSRIPAWTGIELSPMSKNIRSFFIQCAALRKESPIVLLCQAGFKFLFAHGYVVSVLSGKWGWVSCPWWSGMRVHHCLLIYPEHEIEPNAVIHHGPFTIHRLVTFRSSTSLGSHSLDRPFSSDAQASFAKGYQSSPSHTEVPVWDAGRVVPGTGGCQ